MPTLIQDSPCIVQRDLDGKKYTLYKTKIRLRDGSQTIYFFSTPEWIDKLYKKDKYLPCALPDGYGFRENPRNGFLSVKKGV